MKPRNIIRSSFIKLKRGNFLNIYKENLEFLKHNAANIYNTLTKASSEFCYKASYIPEEDNFLIENSDTKCYLHSRFSKENEARMMFHSMPPDTEVVILFGTGCGSAIEYLLKRPGKIRYLIIIEPILEVFKLFLSRNRLSDMGSIGKFTCIINSKGDMVYNALKNALTGELESKLYFAFHISYRTIFRKYYDDIQENVFRLLRTEKTILYSNFVSYKLKALNYISNLSVESLPVELLKPLFKGNPVVIVSAGPSLNKNMHLLDSMKNRAIIIAVGSAIKILDKHGIKPHFRMAYDWTQNEKNTIFDELEDKSIPLIFDDQLFCKILPEYTGKKFRMVVDDSIIPIQTMKKADIEFDTYLNGISVANIALSLVCKVGCSHIIFMGQDMCYKDNNLYADGRSQVNMSQYANNLIQVRNIYGNKVFTIIQYLQIKYDLEKLITFYPHIKFINATEGGLGIDGAVNMDLSEVIEKVLNEPLGVDIEQFVNYTYSSDTLQNYLGGISQGIKKLNECNEELLPKCMEIVNTYRMINDETENISENINYDEIKEMLVWIENNEYYRSTVSVAISSIIKALSYKDSTQQLLTIGNMLSDSVRGKISSTTEYCLFIKKCIENIFKKEIQ